VNFQGCKRQLALKGDLMPHKKKWLTPSVTRFGTVEDLTHQTSEIPGQGGCVAGGFHSNPGRWNEYYGQWLNTKHGGCSDAVNQANPSS
jgi:hypothetical protein